MKNATQAVALAYVNATMQPCAVGGVEREVVDEVGEEDGVKRSQFLPLAAAWKCVGRSASARFQYRDCIIGHQKAEAWSGVPAG